MNFSELLNDFLVIVTGTVYDQAVFRVVCDGYTAPINAGAFVDLVNLYKHEHISIDILSR